MTFYTNLKPKYDLKSFRNRIPKNAPFLNSRLNKITKTNTLKRITGYKLLSIKLDVDKTIIYAKSGFII